MCTEKNSASPVWLVDSFIRTSVSITQMGCPDLSAIRGSRNHKSMQMQPLAILSLRDLYQSAGAIPGHNTLTFSSRCRSLFRNPRGRAFSSDPNSAAKPKKNASSLLTAIDQKRARALAGGCAGLCLVSHISKSSPHRPRAVTGWSWLRASVQPLPTSCRDVSRLTDCTSACCSKDRVG